MVDCIYDFYFGFMIYRFILFCFAYQRRYFYEATLANGSPDYCVAPFSYSASVSFYVNGHRWQGCQVLCFGGAGFVFTGVDRVSPKNNVRENLSEPAPQFNRARP